MVNGQFCRSQKVVLLNIRVFTNYLLGRRAQEHSPFWLTLPLSPGKSALVRVLAKITVPQMMADEP